ncbi:HTH domain-containing protein [Clostridium beijerinckii]|uniref:HTH domain-containing protein n=1 Tax=Clostridium beijerinckii TaxID=1520 RepID=UPI001494C11C|nr:HTH domain-containing protein [Clostridium beijerinckii]NOW06633.1 hypothetical protein [Clostridium beijerinckii]NYC00223.1 hypothetical protein [Clostridium beijerinckii]
MGGKHKNTYHNKDFKDGEIEILSKNSNIKSVSAKQINYTDSFKIHFLDEYAAGKLPLQIFTEAGSDPQMIGQGRIDKAGCRWRRKASRPGGGFDQKKGHSGRKNTLNGQISTEEQIEYLKQQNEYLRQENSFLT